MDLAAVVLAAGAGTRLRPLTRFLPKALCPVGGRPLVDGAVERVCAVTDAVAVNVHHGRALLVAHLTALPVPVHISVEERVHGAAGALGRLRSWIAGRAVLISNADTWQPGDLGELVDHWDGQRARLLCARVEADGDFGNLRYVGSALLPWELVSGLPDEPAGLNLHQRHERGELELVESTGTYIDCGTPADYLRANMLASGGQSVIGAGALVLGAVERSVVWPGGYVGRCEQLTDAIRVGRHTTVTPYY